MATISSTVTFDVTNLNFYEVTQNAVLAGFGPNLIQIFWQNNGSTYKSDFDGSGLTYDSNQNLVGGTITDYIQGPWNGSALIPELSITGFSVSAPAFYDAFLTPGKADDFGIIQSVLSGNDVITTGAGNDILRGFAGNDFLDGGTGVDRAVFSGSSDNFNWATNPNGSITITDLRPGSPEGTDVVQNVEAFEFDSGPDASGGTTTTTFDIGNAFPWSIETRTYNAQGTLSTIFDKMDSGLSFFTDYNIAHANPWNMAVTTYDSQGRLQATSIYKDVTLVTSYDSANNQPWSQAITGYDTQGRLDYVTVVNDDHSSSYTKYSYSGNIDYSIYTYDSQNHLTQSYIHHTDGSVLIV